MIKTLMWYFYIGVGTSNNVFNAGRLLLQGGAKNPFQLKYKYRHQKNAQTPQTSKITGPKTARKYGFTASRKPKINKLLYEGSLAVM